MNRRVFLQTAALAASVVSTPAVLLSNTPKELLSSPESGAHLFVFDRVVVHRFNEAIKELSGLSGQRVPILINHRLDAQPIGRASTYLDKDKRTLCAEISTFKPETLIGLYPSITYRWDSKGMHLLSVSFNSLPDMGTNIMPFGSKHSRAVYNLIFNRLRKNGGGGSYMKGIMNE